MDYEKVTAKEYFEKRVKILNSLGRTGARCYGVKCGLCPFYRGNNHKECMCDTLEFIHPLDAIKLVMDYEIPVDWSKVPVDAKILVKDSSEWYPKHFAKFENGMVYAWPDGKTSFTSKKPVAWTYAKLYEGE